MEKYRRRLPHWQPEGAVMFVAWRLYGSLPQSKRVADETLTPGQRFAARDRELDRATNGPMWLKDSRVAQPVVDTLYLGQHTWKLYDLLAWVLMSNHVHILIKPHTHIAAITRAIKKHSARMATKFCNGPVPPSGRMNLTIIGFAIPPNCAGSPDTSSGTPSVRDSFRCRSRGPGAVPGRSETCPTFTSQRPEFVGNADLSLWPQQRKQNHVPDRR